MKLTTVAEINAKTLRDDPLREFQVWWDDIVPEDASALHAVLDRATREEDVQQYLQQNPKLLIQHLGGGHGRWVIPKQRLGADHVTDFLVGEKHSFGFEWQAVELESPLRPMFNKSGDPSSYLIHAIRQIQDWRIWLHANQNYASRLRLDSGLGLSGIRADLPGSIFIGRRSALPPGVEQRRHQMARELNIKIHTYDYLVESVSGRALSLAAERLRWEDRQS
jgi:hypothetical protein